MTIVAPSCPFVTPLELAMLEDHDAVRVLAAICRKPYFNARKGTSSWTPRDFQDGSLTEAETRSYRDYLADMGYIERIDGRPWEDGCRVLKPIDLDQLRTIYKESQDLRGRGEGGSIAPLQSDELQTGDSVASSAPPVGYAGFGPPSPATADASESTPLVKRGANRATPQHVSGRKIQRKPRPKTRREPTEAQQRYGAAERLTSYFASQVNAELWGLSSDPVNRKALASNLRKVLSVGITEDEVRSMIDLFVLDAKAQGGEIIKVPWKQFLARRDSLLERVRSKKLFISERMDREEFAERKIIRSKWGRSR